MAWASFALSAAGAMGGAWLLFALREGQSSDPQILMWQYVVMMGIFPLMTVVLAYTQMILLRDI
jgi:rod shape-determining protein MreD